MSSVIFFLILSIVGPLNHLRVNQEKGNQSNQSNQKFIFYSTVVGNELNVFSRPLTEVEIMKLL